MGSASLCRQSGLLSKILINDLNGFTEGFPVLFSSKILSNQMASDKHHSYKVKKIWMMLVR